MQNLYKNISTKQIFFVRKKIVTKNLKICSIEDQKFFQAF